MGVRLQAVQVGATATNDAYLQTSMVPLARLLVGRVSLKARLTYNFDTPHGLTFSDDAVWGLSFGGEVRF